MEYLNIGGYGIAADPAGSPESYEEGTSTMKD
jgi:hypothetical protein